MDLPPTAVVVAAAGRGARLGARRPKALVPLAGAPLFLHSVRTFAALPFVREIALVVPPEWVDRAARLCGGEFAGLRVVAGGARRQDSVRAGLEATAAPLVLVHDAARPLVTAGAARDVARAAARHGAAVLAAPAVDTIKVADARRRVVSTPDRSRVWHAQTPQGFRRDVLVRAYRRSGRAAATDDVQLVERSGGTVVIVPSRDVNFKVTTPEDLARAGELLRRRSGEKRRR
jgi:2-C-methyl-D-erythritol 4-phosphate cytidylyltransferase/2-C-methyl-D-erythritol 2,4-cyclodiphosphate synthase